MVIRPNMGPFESFGITRSGALFYEVSDPAGRFQIANVGVSAERLELSSLSGAVEVVGGSPRFSPNGKYVAYGTEETAFGRRPRLYTLWLRSLDSPYTLHRIETGPVTFSSVSGWSPDSRTLLGMGGIDGQARQGIYEIDVATGRVSLLLADCDCSSPQRPPAGGSLYFVRRLDGSGVLVTRDLASGRERELSRQPTYPFLYEFSPDGEYVAVDARAGKVSVMPASGGQSKELVEATFLSWTPDSRSILVSARGATSMVSLDGTSRRTPTLDGLLATLVGSLRLSPDGRHLAFAGVDRAPVPPPRLQKLENFLPRD